MKESLALSGLLLLLVLASAAAAGRLGQLFGR